MDEQWNSGIYSRVADVPPAQGIQFGGALVGVAYSGAQSPSPKLYNHLPNKSMGCMLQLRIPKQRERNEAKSNLRSSPCNSPCSGLRRERP